MTDKDIKAQIQENLEAELTNDQHDQAETQDEGSSFTEFEQKVMKMGWNPKGSKSAEEWLYYGFEDRGRKLSDLGKAVESLKELSSRQEQIAMEKARAELQNERRLAIQRGDVAAVEQIDQKHTNMQVQTEVAHEVNDFIARNADWYNSTTPAALKMRKAAIDMDNQLMTLRLSPKKHYEALDDYIRNEFSSYFENKDDNTKPRTNAVEGGQASIVKTNSSKRQYGFDDLNEAQKSVCRRLERTKVMNQKEYIAMLVQNGDLK